MSFEQRKRVSIGVELAANPSILFLDEPTTGLDSLAAQSLIRNIRKIAQSGRSIVCTIHQPSSTIFHAFDALLLLKRGGRTVYFGTLGENGSELIRYFEEMAGMSPMPKNTNPATWMAYYLSSNVNKMNEVHLKALTTAPTEGSPHRDEEEEGEEGQYNASYWTQFQLLMRRIALTYWRSPNYSLLRIATNLVIALIFGSAYPQQQYSTYVAAVNINNN